MYIDTHAHLDFKKFDNDREEVLQRAREAGVAQIITVGTDIKSSEQNIEIAGKYDGVYAVAGIHPSESDSATEENITQLYKLAGAEEVIAIGECGLDFFKNYKPREVQIAAFKKQIELAKDLNLPLIVHSRGAETECIKLLAEHEYQRAVLHCFGGSLEQAQKAWDLGILTSFTGGITYSDKSDEVIAACPDNLFMIETDCPFLAPVPHRGKRNEPAFVVEVSRKIAEIRGIPLEKAAQSSTQNAQKFFQI